MPDLIGCAGCGRDAVEPVAGAVAVHVESRWGRVDRACDTCPHCGHVVLERLSGPGARAWMGSVAVTVEAQ